MTTTRTIKQTLEAMATLVGGRAWGLDKGKPRIYMPSSKDRKVFFDFTDAAFSSPEHLSDAGATLGGATLCVGTDDCGQAPAWYESQKRIMMQLDSVRRASMAIMAFESDEAFAAAIMAKEDELTDDEIDAASSHLVNGRIAEAKEALGL